MKKSVFSVLAVIVVVAMLLTACSQSAAPVASTAPAATVATTASAAPTVEPTATPAPDPFATHEDVSVGMWSVGTAFPEDGGPDAVRDYIYKKLNITIKPMDFGWGDDAMQKVQLWSASNQLPDIIAGNIIVNQLYTQWITQSTVKALPKDLSAYPNVEKVVNGVKDIITYPMGDPNGSIYCIPRGSFMNVADNAITNGFFIRKDWMQQAGITSIPDNMADFTALLQAYVKMGKVGLTAYNAQWITALMNSYEPGVTNNVYSWIRQDGKWVPAFMSKNILAGLKNIQSMYNSGLIDKDIALFKADEGYDKFFSGKAGAIGMSTDFSGADYFASKYDVLHPGSDWNATFAYVPVFKSADGQRYAYTGPGFWSESYINAKSDDTKTDRILRMFDFFLSNEGQVLMKNGIEGVDYTKNADGSLTSIETKDASGNVYTDMTQKYPSMGLSYFAQWSGDNYYSSPKEKKVVDFIKPEVDFARANYSNKYTDYRLDYLTYPDKDKLTADFTVDMIQAIMSKDIDTEWAKIVKNHLDNGYDKIIQEVNDLAAKDNIK